MTSQADSTCFVSLIGNNIFQDNRVKRRIVTFVYVYFINMKEKNNIEIFYLRTPLRTLEKAKKNSANTSFFSTLFSSLGDLPRV